MINQKITFIVKSICLGTESLIFFIRQLSEKPLVPAPSFNNSIYTQVDCGDFLLRLENNEATYGH